MEFFASNTESVSCEFMIYNPFQASIPMQSGMGFKFESMESIEGMLPQFSGYEIYIDSLKVNGVLVASSPRIELEVPLETFYFDNLEKGNYELFWRNVVVPDIEDTVFVFSGVEEGIIK